MQDRFIGIIKLTKKWHVPDEPPTTAPQRIEMPIVGTLSNAGKDLNRKAKDKDTEFNKYARKEWQRGEYIGENRVLEKIQQLGKLKIDDSCIHTRIEYLSEFDLVGKVKMKELRWCGGVVENISDGTGVNPGKLRQCYKEMKHNSFFRVQFLRQTTPHHVQMSLLMKISGVRIVMAHGESNRVL